MLFLTVIAGIYLFPVGWANLWDNRVETVEISETAGDVYVRLLKNPDDKQEIKLLVRNLRLSRFLPKSSSKCMRRTLLFKLRDGKTVIVSVDPGGDFLWRNYFRNMKENALRVGGNSYRLPKGIKPEQILWAKNRQGIVWSVIKPSQGYPQENQWEDGFVGERSAGGAEVTREPEVIYVTPYTPGGGRLEENVRVVAAIRRQDGKEEHFEYDTRLVELDATGDWAVYSVMWILIGGGGAFGPDVHAVNITTGRDEVLVRGASNGGSFFTMAVGEGLVAWQQAALQPPEFVDVSGHTYIHKLDSEDRWEIPGVPFAGRLQVEDETLSAWTANGELRKYPLKLYLAGGK